MNRLRIICLAALILMVAAPAAFATPYVDAGDSITLSSANWTGYSGYGAGIMDFKIADGTNKFTIGTFCIQDNVDIGWSTYTVGKVSDIVGLNPATNTFNSSTAGEGSLQGSVNWLYAQYSTGRFGTLDSSQQADFQNLLWDLQGEGTLGSFSTDTDPTDPNYSAWYDAYENDYLKNNLASGNPSGKWGTEVLNIVDSCGNIEQNQLVYQPVPEPSTLFLLGAGLACALLLRRRSKTRNI